MKKYYLLLTFVGLTFFSSYSQKNIDLEGKWELISFNGESTGLTFEDFSDCYWCQLDNESKSFVIDENILNASINGQKFDFDIEIKDNQLTLSVEQTVSYFSSNKTETTTGETVYTFSKKRSTMVLSREDYGTVNVYTFKKVK